MRVLHKRMLKQFPQNVLVCVWHQELRLLVALGLQEIQVLFPRDQGGLAYHIHSPNLFRTIHFWQQMAPRLTSRRLLQAHMVPPTDNHLNSLYLSNSNSNSNTVLKLVLLASVPLVRGVTLVEVLVEIRQCLLLERVPVVQVVVVDFRSPPQPHIQVLHPHHKLKQPPLGPQAAESADADKKERRNM